MEGTMCNLPALVELKKRYKFYLFVDEAHSIGALGPTGRGVCDYFSIPPSDVDVLMGTLTKSFGATGGYVAGPKEWIAKLRLHNAGSIYEESMSPVVLQQIWTSLRCIMGDEGGTEGEERLQRLAFNSRYLRLGLKRLGFIVYGHDDSPIIPLLLYNPAKMPAFSHEMLKRKIAVVIVGYPATPLVQSRYYTSLTSSLILVYVFVFQQRIPKMIWIVFYVRATKLAISSNSNSHPESQATPSHRPFRQTPIKTKPSAILKLCTKRVSRVSPHHLSKSIV